MARYPDKDEWIEEILIPDITTPILGGQPVWEGDRLIGGFSNVSSAILADRTRHLKNKVEATLWALGEKVDTQDLANAAADAKEYTNEALAGISAGAPMFATVQDGIDGTQEGEFFNVAGAQGEDTYQILYRHDDGGVATEIGRTPTAYLFRDVALGGASEATEPNLFPDLSLTDAGIFSGPAGNVTLGAVNGRRCFTMTRADGATSGAAWVDFSRDQFTQDVMSASCYVEYATAGAGGRRFLLVQYDGANTELTRETVSFHNMEIVTPLALTFEGVAIQPGTAVIRMLFDAGQVGAVSFSRPLIASGNSAGYRGRPVDIADLEALIDEKVGDGLDEIEQEVSDALQATARQVPAFMGNLVQLPPQFNMPKRINIKQSFHGGAVEVTPAYTQDVAGSNPNRTTYYVGYPGATNTNDGLTKETSVAGLAYLFNNVIGTPTTDVEVLLGPGIQGNGIYYRNVSASGILWNHPFNVSIKAESEVIMSTAERPAELSWSQDGDAWRATRSAVHDVYDASIRDYRGIPIRLKKVDSVVDCQSEAGTWYTDNADVWVHLPDGRQADDFCMVQLTMGGGCQIVVRGGNAFYCENIKWCLKNVNTSSGDADAFSVSTPVGNTGFAAFKNCAFFGGHQNGLDADRVSVLYLEDCTAAYNGLDGFNYHDNINAPQSVVYEIGCHGYSNGDPANGGTQNGSTAHDGMTIFRANCVHYDNYGPCIADVNGCYSFNINCWGGRSTRTGGNTNASFFFNDVVAVTPGETFLVGCGASDSQYDLNTDGVHKVNLRGWRGGWAFGPNVSPSYF